MWISFGLPFPPCIPFLVLFFILWNTTIPYDVYFLLSKVQLTVFNVPQLSLWWEYNHQVEGEKKEINLIFEVLPEKDPQVYTFPSLPWFGKNLPLCLLRLISTQWSDASALCPVSFPRTETSFAVMWNFELVSHPPSTLWTPSVSQPATLIGRGGLILTALQTLSGLLKGRPFKFFL